MASQQSRIFRSPFAPGLWEWGPWGGGCVCALAANPSPPPSLPPPWQQTPCPVQLLTSFRKACPYHIFFGLKLNLRWLLFVHPKPVPIHWHVCVHTHAYTRVHTHISRLMQKKKGSVFCIRRWFWILPAHALHILFYFICIQQFFPFISWFWTTSFTAFLSSPGTDDGFASWVWVPVLPGYIWSFSSDSPHS